VAAGLRDLDGGAETTASMLVSMAAVRLRAAGLEVPDEQGDPEHRLYRMLACEDAATAHSRYNALVGEVVSFARAIEHASAC